MATPGHANSRLGPMVERFRSGLGELAANEELSGAVALAVDGEPVLVEAFGLADRRDGRANRPDTRFNVGSMNKVLTATAVLQLVAEGHLDLDTEALDVLDDHPAQEVLRDVRIHHLLTHTSGLGDYVMKMLTGDRADDRRYVEIEDHRHLWVDDVRQFEPGTGWAYSNVGYLVLGEVIERISGCRYTEHLRRRVLEPAGMAGTGFGPAEERSGPDHAVGHSAVFTPDGAAVPFHLPGAGGPAGGGFSTVRDLLALWRALEDGRLLDPELVTAMCRGRAEMVRSSFTTMSYGYGIVETRHGELRAVGHGGDGPGVSGELAAYPDVGICLAVLCNTDPPAATGARLLLEGLLLSDVGLLPAPGRGGATSFVLEGHPDAEVVTVLGDHNDWQPFASPLERSDGGWTCRADLAEGTYHYRFLVDGRILVDPANPDHAAPAGPFGPPTSVLTVGGG